METIGERITEARLEAKLSQRELARRANITEATLSRYESGAREPKAAALGQLAQVLNVSVDYLLGYTEIKNYEPYNDGKFQNDLDYFLENTSHVLNEYGLMLSGKPLDKHSIDKLITAIQVGVEMIKKENE